MYHILPLALFLCACNTGPMETTQPEAGAGENMTTTSLYDLTAIGLDGEKVPLARYKGKKLMIVNTASECGYTPQYAQLQELHEQFGGDQFAVVGFPCDQFGHQEPGSASDIAAFCQKNYGVTFQMMDKVEVKGAGQHAVYAWLTNKALNGMQNVDVVWNFQKFLVDEGGRWVASIPSAEEPLNATVLDWLAAP
jgi:glutathione peroxidase